MTAPKDEQKILPLEGVPATEIASPALVPFYWADQLPVRSIKWLVNDFFAERSLNLIIGASQAGKSYLALDLAVAIATGRPFLGKAVSQGGILYIATEGQITIRRRLMAARQGLALNEKLIAIIQEPPSNFMNADDVDRIIATAKHINEEMLKATGLPLVMVIIDTMISGFDINDWNNVADTSAAMKVLGRIKDEVRVAVTGVHHHGKDTSRGAAGSYALTAHPDSILSVYKKDNNAAVTQRYVTLTKSRFGETGRQIGFDLEGMPPDLREEEWDDEVFVRLSDSSDIGDLKSGKTKSSASLADVCFQRAFDAALKDGGLDGNHPEDGAVKAVSLSLVKERFKTLYRSKGRGDPAEATRKAWDRAMIKIGNGRIKYAEDVSGEWLYIKVDL